MRALPFIRTNAITGPEIDSLSKDEDAALTKAKKRSRKTQPKATAGAKKRH
jgi:hypothetical protein